MREWGVKGEVKALPLSGKVFSLGAGVEVSLLTPQGARNSAKITSFRKLGKYFIITIEGCLDAASAAKLRGAAVCVPRDSIVLEENEFFSDQLIGVSVVTADGKVIGQVNEIFETGSNDVYVVKTDDKEYLLPAIKDVIQEIDLAGQQIIIKTMPGLLD